MKVPIRMLGIATLIFWVFLAAFIGIATYSIKDLGLEIGETQVSTTPNGELLFSSPVFIDNKGYSSLNELKITTVFFDESGAEISTASTAVPTISQGATATITHKATLNLIALIRNGDGYLLEDQNLAASVTTGLTLAELLPVQISTNFTYPWGAPFHNFRISHPSVGSFNTTHYSVVVPVSFENHAAFDLTGNIKIQLFGSGDKMLSETQTSFNAPRQSSYANEVELQFGANSELFLSQNAYFNIYFSTALFECGPLVIQYG